MEITTSLVFGPKMPSATEWYTIQSSFTPKRCLVRLSPIYLLFIFACDGPTVKRNGEHASWTIFAGLYLGASAHADDVRTLTSSLPCLKQQVYLVQDFAFRNGLLHPLLQHRQCSVFY